MDITDAGIPEPVLGVLEALHFERPSTARLCSLTSAEWDELLDWCDRRQITFVLHAACGDALPLRVQKRIGASLERYSLRFARLQDELASVIDILDGRGISFVVLKGVTHAPEMTPDPLLRAQGDIDLWIPDGAALIAQDALIDAGYRPVGSGHSDRHLRPLARPGTWRWRGDIFDPDMPVRVELHHDLWRSESERIPVPGEHGFRTRLEQRDFGGRRAFVLCPHDMVGFAALHVLLHLLHGDVPLQRAWEIGRFLHLRADDALFWSAWRKTHGPELRSAQALVFDIVRRWFGCRVPACAANEVVGLNEPVRRWLDRFAFSPLRQQSRPNRDQLWLHLALVPSMAGRARVLLRNFFPVHAGRRRILSASRLRHYAATLAPTLLHGLGLRLSRSND